MKKSRPICVSFFQSQCKLCVANHYVRAPVIYSAGTSIQHSARYTPFTKTSPNYPHKNNADNSIKIAFTNSELPKNNLHFIYERPFKKKTLKRRMRCGEGVIFDRALKIVRIILELRSQIQSLVPVRLLCG